LTWLSSPTGGSTSTARISRTASTSAARSPSAACRLQWLRDLRQRSGLIRSDPTNRRHGAPRCSPNHSEESKAATVARFPVISVVITQGRWQGLEAPLSANSRPSHYKEDLHRLLRSLPALSVTRLTASSTRVPMLIRGFVPRVMPCLEPGVVAPA
jgi:hypothetical protein